MLRSLIHFRVIKTVFAAFLAMVAGQIFDPWPIFIVLSACFCIRQTFMGSLDHFYDELKIALVATVIALTAGELMELEYILGMHSVYLTFFNFFITALALGCLVAVTQYYEWYNVILFGLLTVAYILLNRPGTAAGESVFLFRGIQRLGKIMIGSLMALAVDFLFSGFEYRQLFHRRLKQVLEKVDGMLDLFVEAIMFQSAEMMDQTLDLMVDSQNLLNYVTDNLADLESELELRGGDIHGFDYDRLRLIKELLRKFRLISFQVEAGAVNYIELARKMENRGNEEIFPEANYARISERGRRLADRVGSLQQSINDEDPEHLETMVKCDLSTVDYRDLFDEIEEEEIRLLAVDTLSSLSRIEMNLCQAAELFQEYLSRYR